MSLVVRVLSLFFDLLEYFFTKLVDVITNTPPEVKAHKAHFISYKKLLSKRHTGFCINGTHCLSLKNSFKHTMIIGGSGVGKSSTVLIPSLYRMEGSFVVHDPSGELYEKTSQVLTRKGYRIYRLNFADPKTSISINPLTQAQNSSEVNKLASLLIRSALGESKEVFWNIQGASLLQVLISITRTLEPPYHTLHTVRELLLLLKANPTHIDQLASNLKNESILNSYKAFIGYESKIQTSIIATGLASLAIFADTEVMQMTSTDSGVWEKLRKEKTAVFIQTPIQDREYYQPLINVLFEQLLGMLMKRLPQKNELPVFLLLDEIASLYIPSLSNSLANLRKYNCGIMLVLQDFEQLIDVYGRSQARTMKTNCFAKLYFTGQGLETAKELQETLGATNHKDKHGREHTQPLLAGDAIRTLNPKQALLICGHYKPMMVKLKPYFKQNWWKKNKR